MNAARFFKPVAAAVLAGVLLGGCQGLPIDLAKRTVSERSQVDITKGRRISGEASGFQLMLFIPIAVNTRYRNAYDELLKQAGDDLLADVTVIESWQWGFVGTVYTTRIEATAYPRAAAAPAAGDGGTK